MIRFQFVDDAKKNHSVKRLCEVLKLNRSSYYKWKKTSTIRKKRLISDAVLGARIKAVFIKERGCYGSKRITVELNDDSATSPVNHKKVARIMRSLKLFGYTRKRKVTTTVSEGKKPVFPDLAGRKFTAEQPNQVYVGDITYLPIADGSNMYLATVIDCFSRRLVGFAIADHMRTSLVQDAVAMAKGQRGSLDGAVFHSDHGCVGGFNWSSQHLLVRKVFKDGDQGLEYEDQRGPGGDAAAVARGPGVAASNALSGQTAAIEGGAATILAPDRGRGHDSGGSAGGGGVGAGRITVVPSRWRYVTADVDGANWSLSQFRGARGDRDLAFSGTRCPVDRAYPWAGSGHDQSGVAPQRCYPQREAGVSRHGGPMESPRGRENDPRPRSWWPTCGFATMSRTDSLGRSLARTGRRWKGRSRRRGRG